MIGSALGQIFSWRQVSELPLAKERPVKWKKKLLNAQHLKLIPLNPPYHLHAGTSHLA